MTINLGPLALAMPHVVLMVSLALSILTGWWLGRLSKLDPEKQVFRLLLVTLVVARIAFVVTYLEHFSDQPWRAVDIRDGGFIAWPGLLAALCLGTWMCWRDRKLRKPLGWAITVGMLAWVSGSFLLHTVEQSNRLPDLSFRNEQGERVTLRDFAGKPLVVNLWATWCPPCRREMPVMAKAQRELSGTTFLFVNQGESDAVVARFFATEGLGLANVLLDPGGQLGQHVGSGALPTTLFFDAEGRQVGSHLGELSHASLSHALKQLEESTRLEE
ncbi:thiol-disulfide isomerase/thioredoxin [Pseudomonas sp. BIGb0408]|uniref:Thiol-disulfide isomerase/thioredoxin n=2 Tax=Pseudomonadales TaxID=72274 RepID=A0A7Z0BQE8_9GAMM|nr:MULTISPECIES: TlpA disulfide reductase family protein [Pseudomonas]MCW2292357.1 thiol-disulfide isomerase/thioredoxin [Pseudomonas sp. BIGb0408]NYH73071.1 thiol-disulfide isomerase/thioredoxin [Pseudomonas flavescens]